MAEAATDNATKKERAALISIFASAAIALFKFAAALLSGSLALFSEAGHALIDLGAVVLTWFAVRTAEKPADDEHHYGHGKIEAVAALAETALLIGLALFVLYESIHRLRFGGEPVQLSWIIFAVLLGSIVVDLNRWLHLRRVAKETNSVALAADALHFSSDLVSSVMVLVGLAAVYLGYPKGDSLAAIAVALFILGAAYQLGKRTIDTLLDAAPEGSGETVRDALEGVSGIIDVEKVRVRPAGSTLFVDAVVRVPRTYPLDKVQAIKDEAAAAVRRAMPEAETTITAEPKAMDDESILERVILIAARRRTPVHHVTVQNIGDRLSVSLDVEFDGRMSLAAAHQLASKLEDAIRADLGPTTEVETHIEPLDAQGLRGNDVLEAERITVSQQILALADEVANIGEVHDLRVRRTEKGLVVSMHVRADAQATVADVHLAVDQLEHAARAANPDIARIVTHAEPRKAAI